MNAEPFKCEHCGRMLEWDGYVLICPNEVLGQPHPPALIERIESDLDHNEDPQV